MASQRIHVSLNELDFESILSICEKKKMSRSSLVRKVLEEWIEKQRSSIVSQNQEEESK